ncbi:hypothetical protein DL96DRAFT_1552621 [Flagelloscypha sp. PMI_526]|nr:hypothetical protein DL96DRAFT_1552621 [Flagelloscypha sp. PMI_526]
MPSRGLGNDKAQLTLFPHSRAASAKGPIFAWRIIIPVGIVPPVRVRQPSIRASEHTYWLLLTPRADSDDDDSDDDDSDNKGYDTPPESTDNDEVLDEPLLRTPPRRVAIQEPVHPGGYQPAPDPSFYLRQEPISSIFHLAATSTPIKPVHSQPSIFPSVTAPIQPLASHPKNPKPADPHANANPSQPQDFAAGFLSAMQTLNANIAQFSAQPPASAPRSTSIRAKVKEPDTFNGQD